MFSDDSDQVGGDSSMSTWIWRIGLNTCINASKKKMRSLESVRLNLDIDPYEDINEEDLQIRQHFQSEGYLSLAVWQ